MALWTAAGVAVSYLIITDGDAGGFDETVTRSEMAQIRRTEQMNAAKVLGVDDVSFLGYPDGRLTVTHDLRRDISRVIRQRRPQRVVSQSPLRNFARIGTSHPDHLAAGEATLCAVYPDARNPFAHPELGLEGLRPHAVDEVWLAGSPAPDVVSDITETFDQKMAALRCHISQISHIDDLADRLRGWATDSAREGGLAPDRLGERFQYVRTG